MQTKRTLLSGNGTLGCGEDELRLPSATECEGERLDRLGHEPVEDPCGIVYLMQGEAMIPRCGKRDVFYGWSGS
jgi:hypothetical protein